MIFIVKTAFINILHAQFFLVKIAAFTNRGSRLSFLLHILTGTLKNLISEKKICYKGKGCTITNELQ